MSKELRQEGYYWVKWDYPDMSWAIAHWNGTDWHAIDSEEPYSDGIFKFISPTPIPNPYE